MPDAPDPDEVTRIERELRGYQEMEFIEYYLPSDPAGQRFVVGVDGQILNMDPEQAMTFLMGAAMVARGLARQRGLLSAWPLR